MESPDHGDEHELMLQILYHSPKCDPVGFPLVCLTKIVTQIVNRVQYGAGGPIRHLLADSEVETRMLFAEFVRSIF